MILKTYLTGTKQAAVSVPCEINDQECLGQWPGVKQWIESNEIAKYDEQHVFAFTNKNVPKPTMHILGHFNVECRAFKNDKDGKRIGIGMEIKWKMNDIKLEQLNLDAPVDTWSSDQINSWLEAEGFKELG